MLYLVVLKCNKLHYCQECISVADIFFPATVNICGPRTQGSIMPHCVVIYMLRCLSLPIDRQVLEDRNCVLYIFVISISGTESDTLVVS